MPVPTDPIKYVLFIERLRKSHTGLHPSKETKSKMAESRKQYLKDNPEIGRGQNHPRFGKTISADNLSKMLTGAKSFRDNHPDYLVGNNNPMKDPDIVKKVIDSQLGVKRPGCGMPGILHWNYKDGSCVGKNNGFYHPNFNESFKEEIRERDNHVCKICEKTEEENGRKLDVHHIPADKHHNDCFLKVDFVSLCISCHRMVDNCSDEMFEYYEEYLEELNYSDCEVTY